MSGLQKDATRVGLDPTAQAWLKELEDRWPHGQTPGDDSLAIFSRPLNPFKGTLRVTLQGNYTANPPRAEIQVSELLGASLEVIP